MPPPSSSTRHTTFPVSFSSFTNPAPACTKTWSPMTSGLETKPNAGSGLSSSFMKSTRQISRPVARSVARTCSVFLSRVSVTITAPPATTGPE